MTICYIVIDALNPKQTPDRANNNNIFFDKDTAIEHARFMYNITNRLFRVYVCEINITGMLDCSNNEIKIDTTKKGKEI